MNTPEAIISVISNAMQLLTVSEEGQKRKNLGAVKRTRRQLHRQFKKDGINDDEKLLLDKLDNAIVNIAIELGKF